MKKIIFFSIIAFSAIGFNACNNGSGETTTTQKENVSFYNVPLVCPAAPQIGCGSRSKPVLLEMEKNLTIKEAWLNRAGTVYAIVWRDEAQTEKTAKPVFEKYKIDFSEMKDDDINKNAETFRKENLWYRGADVDKLSIEEAGVIAKDAATFAMNEELLSKQEAETIKAEIENYLKTELVKVRTTDELYGQDSQNNFRNNLTNIAAKSIGKERADKITELYMQKKSLEKKEEKSCCTKDKKKDACCSKK